MMMIETRGLCKSFGDHVVLDGIDLDVASGTIFALLGPNGAGKTTMVQILSTLIGADSGEVRVAGHDPAHEPVAVRAAIGVTGQFSAVDTLDAGLGGVTHSGAYIDYVAPAIIIMTVGSGCATTAVNLCVDMAEGIITRFRTMAISRASVLTGQVFGSLIRTMMSIVLVLGIALLMGFRPTTSLVDWIAALGLIKSFTFAVTWMAVVFGLVGKTPAGANSLSLIFLLLPFISSAFVRTESMPVGIRWFAEYQPFTPVIDTLRGLLLGTPIGNSAILAVAWCAGLALVGYQWARAIYNRDPVK